MITKTTEIGDDKFQNDTMFIKDLEDARKIFLIKFISMDNNIGPSIDYYTTIENLNKFKHIYRYEKINNEVNDTGPLLFNIKSEQPVWK
jgi:hypothetical protein